MEGKKKLFSNFNCRAEVEVNVSLFNEGGLFTENNNYYWETIRKLSSIHVCLRKRITYLLNARRKKIFRARGGGKGKTFSKSSIRKIIYSMKILKRDFWVLHLADSCYSKRIILQ